MNINHVCQERGLSLYEDQELKEGEDGESSTISLRDAISLAVPDHETSSGMKLQCLQVGYSLK